MRLSSQSIHHFDTSVFLPTLALRGELDVSNLQQIISGPNAIDPTKLVETLRQAALLEMEKDD